MIKEIYHDKQLIAIIVKKDYQNDGVTFFTPKSFSQQLAYMNHKTGKTIGSHFHNPVQREVIYTQEVLFIRKGKLRVDFYNDKKQYLENTVLEEGDIILLASGGHGFEVIEDVEMFEVKQGPYDPLKDKTHF